MDSLFVWQFILSGPLQLITAYVAVAQSSVSNTASMSCAVL
ncbi:MAG: hypothetical protein RIS79_1820 [Verrucomicrobiota bacterium]|jgi:hypothetical protein